MVPDKTHIATEENLNVTADASERTLLIQYTPKTDKAMFDICDPEGRVVQTGPLESSKQTVVLQPEFKMKGRYFLWIVDGDEIVKGQFLFS
jgi:hypothetical protein